MQTISISATKLKQYISSILNDVAFGNKVAVIVRHGKPIAKIIPIDDEETENTDLLTVAKKYFGVLPDFPDVKKERKFRKRIPAV